MASKIIDRIVQVADEFPGKVAIITDTRSITYKDLLSMAYYFSDWLERSKIKSIGVHVGNAIEWGVIDLGSIISGVTNIALPVVFSNQQLSEILKSICPDVIITDNYERFSRQGLIFSSCSKLLGLDLLEIYSPEKRENTL